VSVVGSEDFDRRHAKTRDEGPVVSDPAAAAKKQECHETTIAWWGGVVQQGSRKVRVGR
jgi:hypothetical protein